MSNSAENLDYGPRYFGALRIFATTPPLRQVTVLVSLIAATFAEGFGMAAILPLLSIAQGNAGGDSALNQLITDIIHFMGLPLDLGVVACLMVAGFVVKAALTMFAMGHVGYTVTKVTTGLRLKLIGRLLEAKWSYFAHQPVGRFGNAISGEAARAGDAYLSVATLIALSFQTVMYLILAYLMSWQLALAAIALGAIIVVSLNWLIRMTKRAGRTQTARTRSLTAGLTDALIGLKPLKAMARNLRFTTLFDRDVKELKRALRRQVLARNATRSMQEVMIVVAIAVGFYGAVEIAHYPVDQVIVIALLLIKTVLTLAQSQRTLQSVNQCESAYWSLHETIKEAEAAKEVFIGTRQPTLERGIEFHNVVFSFGSKDVLRGVSLEIPAGQVTTVTGGSGAGKTTTADLVLGLYMPKSGDITIDGVSLRDIDLHKWRAMTGYVPQEVILFHDTIYANIALGDPVFDPETVRNALEAAGAWEFVMQLPDGMESVVGERGTLLSGGQRQRIAVARAIVHRPKLVILDEATSALDPETEFAICTNLKSLSRRTGLTILAITHQPAWVEAADRLYRIADGRVIEPTPQSAAMAAS
ncbi:MAG: ABC transporter ATP-binding protein [Dongiaceae bacterium]